MGRPLTPTITPPRAQGTAGEVRNASACTRPRRPSPLLRTTSRSWTRASSARGRPSQRTSSPASSATKHPRPATPGVSWVRPVPLSPVEGRADQLESSPPDACSHSFCLECIQEWRKIEHKSEEMVQNAEACPMCRVESAVVIPSECVLGPPLSCNQLTPSAAAPASSSATALRRTLPASNNTVKSLSWSPLESIIELQRPHQLCSLERPARTLSPPLQRTASALSEPTASTTTRSTLPTLPSSSRTPTRTRSARSPR